MKKRVLALLSDIHSNYQAFRACFEDAIDNGANEFVFLGDYISDLSETKETMALLRDINSKYKCYFLRGNRERYMLECHLNNSVFCCGSKTGSLLYTYEQLSAQDLDFFNSIPIYDKLLIDDITFEIAHSVKNNDRYYYDENSKIIDNLFENMGASYFLTGHSHRQYIKKQGGKTIVNPGSVGVPRVNGAVAQYCLIEMADGKVEFSLRHIPYNIPMLIEKQFSSGLVDLGKSWSVSILYDVITGREYTMELLNKVLTVCTNDNSAMQDENIWMRFALELGIKFSKKEILSLVK